MTRPSLLQPLTGGTDFDFSSINAARSGELLGEFSKLFIELPSYSAIHGRFDILRSLGNSTKGRQQRSMTLVSPPSTGKSTIAEVYCSRINQTEGGDKKIPVVYVTVGNKSTCKALSSKILRELKDGSDGSIFYLWERIAWGVEFFGVELLIIDEVHHMLSMNKPREIVKFFKSFLNDALCPVVFIGTDAIASIFDQDDEMSQRVLYRQTVVPLTASEGDLRTYATFLQLSDRWLQDNDVFNQQSDFIDDFAFECLFEVSQGHVGWTARILQSALINAKERHATRIEFYDLALATDRWKLKDKFVKHNPFRGERAPCVQ